MPEQLFLSVLHTNDNVIEDKQVANTSNGQFRISVKHVFVSCQRGPLPGDQSLNFARRFAVDGHHEATTNAHGFADKDAITEERRNGRINGSPISFENISVGFKSKMFCTCRVLYLYLI